MASSPVDSETLRSRPQSINVSKAKSIFSHLARELSKKSSIAAEGKDIEKGRDENDVFDLREYLTSSNDANQRAGIKHKHVRFALHVQYSKYSSPTSGRSNLGRSSS
jgi:ATP-binding cassette, subfamily G (WHITE), member 2, SNQ2